VLSPESKPARPTPQAERSATPARPARWRYAARSAQARPRSTRVSRRVGCCRAERQHEFSFLIKERPHVPPARIEAGRAGRAADRCADAAVWKSTDSPEGFRPRSPLAGLVRGGRSRGLPLHVHVSEPPEQGHQVRVCLARRQNSHELRDDVLGFLEGGDGFRGRLRLPPNAPSRRPQGAHA